MDYSNDEHEGEDTRERAGRTGARKRLNIVQIVGYAEMLTERVGNTLFRCAIIRLESAKSVPMSADFVRKSSRARFRFQ